MGDNKPRGFHSPKQVYLTQLRWMCLITCGQEVHRLKVVRMYACPWLDLIGNAMNYGFSFVSHCKLRFWTISQEPGYELDQSPSTWPVFKKLF